MQDSTPELTPELMESLTIKTDTKNVDWEQLAAVYRAAYGSTITAERIRNIFLRSWATRIAVWDGEIVGGVYAFSDGELDASVHGLATHPDYQRRGIGRALMGSIVSSFEPHMAVLLTTEPHNENFYRKAGFRPLKGAMAINFPAGQMED